MIEPADTQRLRWYALKVRTKSEHKLQHALTVKGLETFLPTSLEVRRYSDRMKKVKAALFPGYLFCRLDSAYLLPVVSTTGVESIVGRRGVAEHIDDQEIHAIQRAIQSDKPAMSWPYLKNGDRVRVQFGALQGVEGTLVKAHGVERLVLSVHLLQRSISIEIERDWIRPI